jgi:hypothetical protein
MCFTKSVLSTALVLPHRRPVHPIYGHQTGSKCPVLLVNANFAPWRHGCADVTRAVASTRAQVVGSSPDRLVVPDSAAARAQLGAYVARYAREISELLLRMPRELLLLLKTNDCLRAVDRELGQVRIAE